MAMTEHSSAAPCTVRENDAAASKKPRQKPPWERIDLNITIVSAETSDGRALRVLQPSEAKPLFCLEIPQGLLCKWYVGKDRKSYINCVNKSIPDNATAIRSDCERLEKCLQLRAAEVYNVYSKAKGRRKYEMIKKCVRLCVKEGEVTSVDDADRWKEQCDQLEKRVVSLYEDMAEAIASYEEKMEGVQNELSDVKQQLYTSPEANTGKPISDVGTRQARRQLNRVKTYAEKALWFANTFGLKPTNLELRKTATGSPVKIAFNPSDSQPSTSQQSTSEIEDELVKVKQVLYLLDKFAVSDEYYHEMSMLYQDMPRINRIKEARKALNGLLEEKLLRTPGSFPGVYRSFRDQLSQEIALTEEHYPEAFPSTTDSRKCVRVKISGDGARFSRSTSFVLLSFAFPDLKSEVLSGTGNHTFAAVGTGESYEALSTAFADVFKEINEMIQSPAIVVNGVQYDLDIYLGGDYKFLLLVLGLNEANALYSCVWCHIHKDDRWDTSKAETYYNQELARTITSIKTCACLSKSQPAAKRLGVKHPPLIDISLEHVIVDELHLFLRITDILLRNVIQHVIEEDLRTTRKADLLNGPRLKMLVKCIRKCGISFRVWCTQEGEGSKLDWTSLMGPDKRKLLEKLPAYFNDILPSATDLTTKLWRDFQSLYQKISTWNLPQIDVAALHSKAKMWLETFLSMSSVVQGYQRRNITPYMHILVYHVPEMIKTNGNIKQFSGQGVEKNNDDSRRNYFSSNKWDAPKEILISEERISKLRNMARNKRKYTKKDTDYWEERILESRAAKRPHICMYDD